MDNGSVVYGFAFVDCARLRFWVGSIDDDASCSALGALLMQVCSNASSHTIPVCVIIFYERSFKYVKLLTNSIVEIGF